MIASEKEASEADLQASKMQVEAADAAEDTKKHLEEPNSFSGFNVVNYGSELEDPFGSHLLDMLRSFTNG
ncbi:hypothetical protein RJ639_005665 [Escallonia herrerae]|uniref:Uncharacterized protein n=1 Tax=Escallonia herrerae TaxID=1293975 RepID=A0AA88W2T6_9ASTE|nr:hypothetical protein RJ639_005665 [Escallonia herrerae]